MASGSLLLLQATPTIPNPNGTNPTVGPGNGQGNCQGNGQGTLPPQAQPETPEGIGGPSHDCIQPYVFPPNPQPVGSFFEALLDVTVSDELFQIDFGVYGGCSLETMNFLILLLGQEIGKEMVKEMVKEIVKEPSHPKHSQKHQKALAVHLTIAYNLTSFRQIHNRLEAFSKRYWMLRYQMSYFKLISVCMVDALLKQ
eukprot:377268_1